MIPARGVGRRRRTWTLIPILAILGLLAVPVECAMVHGPHSIFVPVSALAAAEFRVPAAPHGGSRRDAGRDHQRQFHASATTATHAATADPAPIAVAASSRLIPNAPDLIPTLTSLLGVDTVTAETLAQPRLISLSDATAAPGVPAMLAEREAAAPPVVAAGVTDDARDWPPERTPRGPDGPPPERHGLA